MQTQLGVVSKKVDDNHNLIMAEVGHLKRRHARLLSLYSAGLEGTLEASQRETIESPPKGKKILVEGVEKKDQFTIDELECPT